MGYTQPLTCMYKNPYTLYGYGFWRVWAQVVEKNPRVARDSPYLLLALHYPIICTLGLPIAIMLYGVKEIMLTSNMMDLHSDVDDAMDVDLTHLDPSPEQTFECDAAGKELGTFIPLPGPIMARGSHASCVCEFSLSSSILTSSFPADTFVNDGTDITRAMLVKWCKCFHLPYSGNMTILHEKLRWYSKHKEEWNKWVPL